MRRRLAWRDVLPLIVLLFAAAATWGPLYGDATGYRAAFGGVLVGLAVAVLCLRLRLTAWLTAVLGVVAYLLFGGVCALPTTAIAGILPGSTTLRILLVQAINGWKDLLTISPPVSAFPNATVLPYLVGVAAGVLALSIAMRTKRPEWSLLPVGLQLLLGILWGSQYAPYARWIGLAMGVLGLVWCAWLRERRRVTLAETASQSALQRRRLGAAAIVLTGALVAGFAGPVLTHSERRFAIRDHITPQLNVREYSSPLSRFRSYVDQQGKETMFTVKGLPQGGRIRLASLDAYNGIVYNVSDSPSEAFRRIGTVATQDVAPAGSTEQTLEITIDKYNGVWIPGGGDLQEINFTGSRSDDLTSSLYYSPQLETVLTTEGLTSGDTYTTTVNVPQEYSDAELAGRSFGAVEMEDNTGVPTIAVQKAQEFIGGKTDPIEQARALEQVLYTTGYYTDGTEGYRSSRPGHRAQRITSLLDADHMQGDDEQYAVAMALMARASGMPARVVMGFYPDSYGDGTIEITGRDAHVWVEIYFDGVGWVTFDPTPPRDQKWTEPDPDPQPNPQPQVLQPPDPPDDPVELEIEPAEDNRDDSADERETPRWLFFLLIGALGILLILAPFVLILLLKRWRTKRRRTTGAADVRAAGAWEDVLDTARDGNIAVDPRQTRGEQARSISAVVTSRLRQRKLDEASSDATAAQATPARAVSVPAGAASVPTAVTPTGTQSAAPHGGGATLGTDSTGATGLRGDTEAIVWGPHAPSAASTSIPAEPRPRQDQTARRSRAVISSTASLADRAVFSWHDISPQDLNVTWDIAEQAKAAIRRVSSRRSRFSLRSLRYSRHKVPRPSLWSRLVARLPRRRDDDSASDSPVIGEDN
ncbi:MAG: transglutaminase domain-containing protein [Actinomycetaceae bacterium]|nr:transglutaminase domain-containing protein [Actinomycetaceae bacterium]